MATLLEHLETGQRYVLVGIGFGAYEGGSPTMERGVPVVAYADGEGDIRWARSNQLRVVSVDGVSPQQWLTRGEFR